MVVLNPAEERKIYASESVPVTVRVASTVVLVSAEERKDLLCASPKK